MDTVFVVFGPDYDGDDNRETVGVYSTQEKAVKAIEDLYAANTDPVLSEKTEAWVWVEYVLDPKEDETPEANLFEHPLKRYERRWI